MNRAYLAIALSLVAPAALADSAEDALKRFVDGAQTVTATFEQVQRNEDGKLLQTTSGRMWLSRPAAGSRSPGRFRWAYEKPYEQVMVCDGEKIWMYDPDLAQVTVRPAQEALAGTPAELLSRRSTLGEQFTLEDGGVKDGVQVVRLKPKFADGDFKSIALSLRGSAPVQMLFHDQLGGTSEVTFGDVRINEKVDEKQFRFTPPKGAEVVEAAPTERAE
jgi:outer membrane lipoprotein carrier protein